MDETALYNLSYGVYAVTTWDKGKATGCIANSAMQITATPATIAVSINRENHTHACIEDCGMFAINILSENVAPIVIGTFGFRSGRDIDKFADTEPLLKGYLPILPQAMSYITCKVINKMETDTHTVFLGEVTDAGNLKAEKAMTYAYYHNVIKGKAPKTAPTYRGDL